MRRALPASLLAALLLAGTAPVAGGALVVEEYGRLAERNLRPAPLVLTYVPPALTPVDRWLALGSTGRAQYGMRVATNPPAPAAVVALQRGAHRSLKAARAYFRRQGFRARSTRVRGRRGVLLTRRLGRTTWYLVWSEDRRVYELGTGTPRTVSLRRLRAVAAGLEELRGYYIGGDPLGSGEGDLAVTEKTVSGNFSWTANCTDASGVQQTQYAGTMAVSLAPARGARFSFPLRDPRPNALPWTGTVTGTVGRDAVTLSLRATAPYSGMSCDTGQLSLTLPRSRG
jgi:hypothetical protein